MCEMPELPDFLRVPRDYRPERATKRLKWTSQMTFTTKRKDEDPATRKLRREIEAQKKAKQAERFAMLKERSKR